MRSLGLASLLTDASSEIIDLVVAGYSLSSAVRPLAAVAALGLLALVPGPAPAGVLGAPGR